jgi:hypothetical protein
LIEKRHPGRRKPIQECLVNTFLVMAGLVPAISIM